jgi:hypothetical protein
MQIPSKERQVEMRQIPQGNDSIQLNVIFHQRFIMVNFTSPPVHKNTWAYEEESKWKI